MVVERLKFAWLAFAAALALAVPQLAFAADGITETVDGSSSAGVPDAVEETFVSEAADPSITEAEDEVTTEDAYGGVKDAADSLEAGSQLVTESGGDSASGSEIEPAEEPDAGSQPELVADADPAPAAESDSTSAADAGAEAKTKAETKTKAKTKEKAKKAKAKTKPKRVVRPSISYRAYDAGSKWQAVVAGGKNAKADSIQAIKVKLDCGSYSGKVKYKVRVDGSDWAKNWTSGSEIAGKTGRGAPITGIKVKLAGEVSRTYDVLYRVRDKDAGWKDWTFNGHAASAPGGVRSFWIRLFKKGSSKKLADGAYFLRNAEALNVVVVDPKSSTDKGVQMRSAENLRSDAQKFYVRNEGDGQVSIQVMASGLFLKDSNGRIVQDRDSASKAKRWLPVFDNGLSFVNASTGKVIAVKGDKVKSRKGIIASAKKTLASKRWFLSSAKLITSGHYRVRSAVGTYLDIAGGSYSYGANVQAYTRNASGAQAFHIYEAARGYYYIENEQTFLVVDVQNGSTANQANVIQSQKRLKAQNLWKPEYDRSGKLYFTNMKSGKVLEVAGSSKRAGTNVRQGRKTGAAGQLWALEKSAPYSLSGNSELDHHVANVLRACGDLRSAFYWTVHHPYREGQRYYSNPHVLPDSQTISLANDFFARGSGNCYRFACAFSWLARGLGYSANVISGWVPAAAGGRAPHGWVEVYSGATHVCDPDLSHEMPSYNWYMRTYATAPIAYHSW